MSGIGIAAKTLYPRQDNMYHAKLYYLRKGGNQIDIHILITKDLESHATIVQQQYTASGATSGPHLSVEFESDSISLEVPSEGVILENGWRIFPLFSPVISKAEVDNFRPGRRIPSFQLKAEWTKQSKPSQLIHKVTLKGAKECYFSIALDCDSISPRRTRGDLHSKYPLGMDSEPELPDLMNEVASKIPSKWRDIGLQLGLDLSVLEEIASSGDTNLCYINVFSRWKNQNSTTHPYTWSTIVQALQAPAVGEERLADKIKNKLTGQ